MLTPKSSEETLLFFCLSKSSIFVSPLVSREQEKQFRAKRIQDAFSLMQDLLTSKPENLIGSQSLSCESRLKDCESTGKNKSDHPLKRTSTANLRPPRGGGKRNAKNVSGGISAAKIRSSGVDQAQSEVNRGGELSGTVQTPDVGLRQDRTLKGTHTLSPGVGLRQDHSLKGTHTLSPGVGLRQDHSLKGTHTLSPGVGLRQDPSLKGTHTLSSGVGLRQDPSLKGTHTLSPGVGLRQDRTLHTLSSTGSNKLRKISSVEGLTEDEQEQMAYILVSPCPSSILGQYNLLCLNPSRNQTTTCICFAESRAQYYEKA